MPTLPPDAQAKIVNKAGMGGLNTIDDPKDISDQECSDIFNCVFDEGYIGPRKGSLLHRAKPEGEDALAFQILKATTSDGIDYAFVCYGTNFYLDDVINDQWVKLNHDYTPPTSNLYYGSTPWNNGIIDDRYYFCNGMDDVMKWIPAVNTLKVAALAADATLTLNSSVRFPSSGKVVVQGTSGAFLVEYSANDIMTGVLTVIGTVGQNVPIGSTVTTQIQDMSSFPMHGKILIKSQGRLFMANAYTFENKIYYSYAGDPEDYTIDSTPSTAGFYTIFHGVGGINDLTDFGEYLLVEKQSDLLNFSFVFDSTNTNFIVQVTPVISGDNIGPVSNQSNLNYMNTLYYPTATQGIVSFAPATTGSQTTAGLQVLSAKINNFIQEEINFVNSRRMGFNQKLFWACAQRQVGVPETINNLTLMYDLIRNVWTKFDNWNATDFSVVNQIPYYLSANDGGMYQIDVDYQDALGGEPEAYTASFRTKRFDLDAPEVLMTAIYAYVQGYITSNTKLFCDVLFNENGSLGKQTFLIKGNDEKIVQTALLGGLGFSPLTLPLLGGFDLATMDALGKPSFFRAYLQVIQALKPHNLQLNFYSVDIGSKWGVSCYTLITRPLPSADTNLVIGPTMETPPVV